MASSASSFLEHLKSHASSFDMEDWFLPFVAVMIVGFVGTIIGYRHRSHRHHNDRINTYNPLVAIGSLSALGFVILFTMKSVGIFDRAPFTYITAGLRHSGVVGSILLSTALAPLADDIRHQYQHHRLG